MTATNYIVGNKNVSFNLLILDYNVSNISIKIRIEDDFVLDPALSVFDTSPTHYNFLIEQKSFNSTNFTEITLDSIDINGFFGIFLGFFQHKTSSLVRPIEVSIYNKSQYLIEKILYNITMIVNTLKEFKLIPDQKTASQLTNLQVSFRPISIPKYGDIIVVKFPLWNPGAPAPLRKGSLSVSSKCYGLKGLDNGLSCSFKNDTLEIFTGDYIPNSDGLIIVNITEFRNPQSMKGLSPILLTTKAPNGGFYDKSEDGKVLIFSPASPRNFSFQSSSKEIRQQTNFTFSFFPSSYIDINSEAELIFPVELDLSRVKVFGLENVQIGELSFVYNFILNSIRISNINNEYIEQKAIKFMVSDVKNPLLPLELNQFSFALRTSDGFIAEEIKSGLSYRPTSGILKNLEIINSNKTIGIKTNYTVKFNSPPQFFAQTDIKMTFPKEIELTAMIRKKCSDLVKGLNPLGECEIVNQVFTLYNAFQEGFPGGPIMITLQNVKNPPSSISGEAVSVYTYYNSEILDISENSVFFECDAGILDYFRVSNSDLTICAVAEYYFEFVLRNPMPLGAYFELTFPLEFSDFLGAAATEKAIVGVVKINGTIHSLKTLLIPSSRQLNLYFTDNFQPLPAMNLTLIISNVKNPRTLNPTGSFNLTTRLNQGFIDILTTPTSIKMELPASLSNISISRSNSALGSLTSMIISFDLKISLYKGDIVEILLPGYLNVTKINKEKCLSINYGTSNISSSCVVSIQANSLLFSISKNISDPMKINFTIFDLMNPFTPGEVDPSMSMLIKIFDTNNQTVAYTILSQLQLQFSPAQLSTFVVTTENFAIGNSTVISFIIKLKNSLPALSTVVISLPQEFKIIKPRVQLQESDLEIDCGNSIISINLKNDNLLIADTVLKFEVSGLVNPAIIKVYELIFKINFLFGLQQYVLQQGLYSASWGFNCSSACKLCSETYNYCTDCEIGKYLLDNTCVSSCTDQENLVVRQGNICLRCKTSRSNCARCDPYELERCSECLSGFQYSNTTNNYCVEINKTTNSSETDPVKIIDNSTTIETNNPKINTIAIENGCLLNSEKNPILNFLRFNNHFVILYLSGLILILIIISKIFLKEISIFLFISTFWSLIFQLVFVLIIIKLLFLRSWLILGLISTLALSGFLLQIIASFIITRLLNTDTDFLLASNQRGVNCLVYYLIYLNWRFVLFYFGNPGFCTFYRFTNQMHEDIASRVLVFCKIDLGLTGIFIFVIILFLAMAGQGSDCWQTMISYFDAAIFSVIFFLALLCAIYTIKKLIIVIKTETDSQSNQNPNKKVDIEAARNVEAGGDSTTLEKKIPKVDEAEMQEKRMISSETVFKRGINCREENLKEKCGINGANNDTLKIYHTQELELANKSIEDREDGGDDNEVISAGPSVGYSIEKKQGFDNLKQELSIAKVGNPAENMKSDGCEPEPRLTFINQFGGAQGAKDKEIPKNIINPFSDEGSRENHSVSQSIQLSPVEITKNCERKEITFVSQTNKEGERFHFRKTILEEETNGKDVIDSGIDKQSEVKKEPVIEEGNFLRRENAKRVPGLFDRAVTNKFTKEAFRGEKGEYNGNTACKSQQKYHSDFNSIIKSSTLKASSNNGATVGFEDLNSLRSKQEEIFNKSLKRKQELSQIYSEKVNSFVHNSSIFQQGNKLGGATPSYLDQTSKTLRTSNPDSKLNSLAKTSESWEFTRKSTKDKGNVRNNIDQLKLSTSNSPWKMTSMAMQRQKIQLKESMIKCKNCGDSDQVRYCERCKSVGYCNICRNCPTCSGSTCSPLKPKGVAFSKDYSDTFHEKSKPLSKILEKDVGMNLGESYDKMQLQNWIRNPVNSSGSSSSELSLRQYLPAGKSENESAEKYSYAKQASKSYLTTSKPGFEKSEVFTYSLEEISDENQKKFSHIINESPQKGRKGFF